MAPQETSPVAKLVLRNFMDRDSGNITNFIIDMGYPGRPAALIDPVEGQAERNAKYAHELGVTLVYIMDTHVPVDHKSGTSELKKKFPKAKSVASKASGAIADILVEGGDTLRVGNVVVRVLRTPGHTKGCVTFVTGDGPGQHFPAFAFTGHSLLIRGKGRTDHEDGDAEVLSKSVHEQIFTLPRHTLIIPGFDFERSGFVISAVREEMAHNPYFQKQK